MPIRWNSSDTMLKVWLYLKKAIRGVFTIHQCEIDDFVYDKLVLNKQD
jgi:hypothetical protein